jgi:glutamate-1-semialdehyde 2,1-aminomutase
MVTTAGSVETAPTTWPDAREKYGRATHVMPGGNSRTQLFVPPFPLYVERGYGNTIVLTDGKELTDFLLNYTAAAVGYAHPEVVGAAKAALDVGAPFGMPTAYEIAMAEALQKRVPTLERVRFTNSGSEATLHAIRVARAYSGRSVIAKAEGAYHGSHDLADYSVWKLADEPLRVQPQTPGMPPALADSVVLFPYNDLSGTLEVLDRHRDKLATVLVEVFLNSPGVIPADNEYLQGIGAWCRNNDVLFTIDEVASFRTGYRGAHFAYGLKPDLLCIGKSVGGGFAIGVFGGREDVMDLFDPRRPGHVKHAGTFNAHPVTLAAGLKVLEILDEPTIERMNALGRRIVDGIRSIGRERRIPLTATGLGSIGNLHFSETPPTNPHEAGIVASDEKLDLFWALVERGYSIAPRGQFSTASVTTEEQVDGLLEAIESAAVETLKG